MATGVAIDVEATGDELRQVETVFREVGFEGVVEASYGRKAAGELPWIVYVATPFSTFFTAYLAKLGQEAGKDSWPAIKKFVAGIWASRGNRDGTLVFEDRQRSATVVVISSNLPEEAFKELAALDFEALEGAYLVWNEDSRRWQDAMRGR